MIAQIFVAPDGSARLILGGVMVDMPNPVPPIIEQKAEELFRRYDKMGRPFAMYSQKFEYVSAP